MYGLLLMPVGTIVFVEHWVFPQIGLAQYWFSRTNKLLNWPALLAWGITLAGAVTMWRLGYIHEFFLIIPVWLSTAILYIILCFIFGATEQRTENRGQMTDDRNSVIRPSDSRPLNEPAEKSALYYISGPIALASLAVCLGMAIWVAVSAGQTYNDRLDFFKTALKYITVIYFVFGTTWIFLKEKKES